MSTVRPASRRVAAANYYVHESAFVDPGCQVGQGSKIWHFCHLMGGAVLGSDCNLGQNVFVADGVVIGRNVKIQNNVSIYTGTVIEDDVFLGPSCVLTNISNPRAQVNRRALYETTLLRRGCSVGANATIVCGISIGRYAFIAAGSVVTKDVPDYGLMMGVAARQVGWSGRHGHRLVASDQDDGSGSLLVCPESGLRYRQDAGRLACLDVDEDAALPEQHTVGTVTYREIRPRGGQP